MWKYTHRGASRIPRSAWLQIMVGRMSLPDHREPVSHLKPQSAASVTSAARPPRQAVRHAAQVQSGRRIIAAQGDDDKI